MNTDLLKAVLAVPTKSCREGLLVEWLLRYCAARGLSCQLDPSFNVYVAKGELAKRRNQCSIMKYALFRTEAGP